MKAIVHQQQLAHGVSVVTTMSAALVAAQGLTEATGSLSVRPLQEWHGR